MLKDGDGDAEVAAKIQAGTGRNRYDTEESKECVRIAVGVDQVYRMCRSATKSESGLCEQEREQQKQGR